MFTDFIPKPGKKEEGEIVKNIIFAFTLVCFISFTGLVNTYASSDSTVDSIYHSGNFEDDDECEWDFDEDGDVDGEDLFELISKEVGDDDDDDDDGNLAEFAADFGRNDCPIDS